MKIPKQLTDITPEYLTKIFKETGHLIQGSIKTAIFKKNDQSLSSICGHFDLLYSIRSKGKRPDKIFIKLAKNDGREVAFYKYIAKNNISLDFFIECYFAEYYKKEELSIVILKDLSEYNSNNYNVSLSREYSVRKDTEANPSRYPMPNDQEYSRIIETIAKFHAHWWEDKNISNKVSNLFQNNSVWDTEDNFKKWMKLQKKYWKEFYENESKWLPKEYQKIFESVLKQLPNVWKKYFKQRIDQGKHFTLVHGHSCSYHFMRLSKEVNEKTKMIDFKDMQIANPARDLVYLNTIRLNPAQRNNQDIEKRMLKYYYEILQKRGVTNYSFEQLMIDYKIEVILALLTPLREYSCQGPDYLFWWYKLQNLKHAYIDLECSELFMPKS